MVRTKSWIDDHRNLTNAMASEFDLIDNLQVLTPVLSLGTNQELTPTELIDNITEFEGNDLIQLQPVTNTSLFMGNYPNEYTPSSDIASNILPIKSITFLSQLRFLEVQIPFFYSSPSN